MALLRENFIATNASLPLKQVLDYLQLDTLPEIDKEKRHSTGRLRFKYGEKIIPIDDNQQVILTVRTNQNQEGENVPLHLYGNISGDNIQFTSAWINNSNVADLKGGCEAVLGEIQKAIETKIPIRKENLRFEARFDFTQT